MGLDNTYGELPDNIDDWESEDYANFWYEQAEPAEDDGSEQLDEEFDEEYLECEETKYETVPTARSDSPKQSVSTAKAPAWFYDSEGYYAYVLFNGEQLLIEQLKEALNKAGIKCSYANRSFKPATNGVQYDWYLRVYDPNEKLHPRLEVITEAVSSVDFLKGCKAADYSELHQRIHELELEIVRVRTSLETEQSRISDKQQKIWTLEHNLARLQQQHEKRIGAYEKEIDLLTKRITALHKDDSNKEELTKKLKELKQDRKKDLETIDEIAKETEDQIGRLNTQIVDLQNEKAILNHKLGESELKCEQQRQELVQLRSRQRSKIGGRNAEDEFISICDVLLPKINLMWGSAAYLVHEVSDTSSALGVLAKICWNAKNLKADRVESTKKWKELHFSTGESDAGRIYYRLDKGKIRYHVLVSNKSSQRMDIRNLARYDD
ncbi:MAG: hypothetical protein ACYC6Z_07565 [Thermoleophilia bacterium]